MKNSFAIHRFALAFAAAALAAQVAFADAPAAPGYDALAKLFEDWRAFEQPPMKDGAPDYTAATLARRQQELTTYRNRLEASPRMADATCASRHRPTKPAL